MANIQYPVNNEKARVENLTIKLFFSVLDTVGDLCAFTFLNVAKIATKNYASFELYSTHYNTLLGTWTIDFTWSLLP